MARAARRGELARGFRGSWAVIGVSTNPGLNVTTATSGGTSRCPQALEEPVDPALGGTVDVIALPPPIARHGADDRDACRAPCSFELASASKVRSATVAEPKLTSSARAASRALAWHRSWSGSIAVGQKSHVESSAENARLHHRAHVGRDRARRAPRSRPSRHGPGDRPPTAARRAGFRPVRKRLALAYRHRAWRLPRRWRRWRRRSAPGVGGQLAMHSAARKRMRTGGPLPGESLARPGRRPGSSRALIRASLAG